MVDRVEFSGEVFPAFADALPSAVGLERCESLCTHLLDRKMIAGNYLSRHFLLIQEAAQSETMINFYGPPGTENPAGGLTEQTCDVVFASAVCFCVCGLLRPFG